MTAFTQHPDGPTAETKPKRKSYRYCRNCGLAIERAKLHTGRIMSGPFWRDAWVHTGDRNEACMWRAEPKRRGDRTLYEQISDLRAKLREVTR